MAEEPVIRDERAVAVADASSRYAYMVLAFGVMIDIVVRGVVWNQNCWELLGLVMVSSGVATLYQRAKRVRVLSRRLIMLLVIVAVIGGVLGAGIPLLLRLHR